MNVYNVAEIRAVDHVITLKNNLYIIIDLRVNKSIALGVAFINEIVEGKNAVLPVGVAAGGGLGRGGGVRAVGKIFAVHKSHIADVQRIDLAKGVDKHDHRAVAGVLNSIDISDLSKLFAVQLDRFQRKRRAVLCLKEQICAVELAFLDASNRHTLFYRKEGHRCRDICVVRHNGSAEDQVCADLRQGHVHGFNHRAGCCPCREGDDNNAVVFVNSTIFHIVCAINRKVQGIGRTIHKIILNSYYVLCSRHEIAREGFAGNVVHDILDAKCIRVAQDRENILSVVFSVIACKRNGNTDNAIHNLRTIAQGVGEEDKGEVALGVFYIIIARGAGACGTDRTVSGKSYLTVCLSPEDKRVLLISKGSGIWLASTFPKCHKLLIRVDLSFHKYKRFPSECGAYRGRCCDGTGPLL